MTCEEANSKIKITFKNKGAEKKQTNCGNQRYDAYYQLCREEQVIVLSGSTPVTTDFLTSSRLAQLPHAHVSLVKRGEHVLQECPTHEVQRIILEAYKMMLENN